MEKSECLAINTNMDVTKAEKLISFMNLFVYNMFQKQARKIIILILTLGKLFFLHFFMKTTKWKNGMIEVIYFHA
jgi:hypothetical protein